MNVYKYCFFQGIFLEICFMPKIALSRPAISKTQPCGLGEVGACAYRGGGGGGGGGGEDPSRFSKKYLLV